MIFWLISACAWVVLGAAHWIIDGEAPVAHLGAFLGSAAMMRLEMLERRV